MKRLSSILLCGAALCGLLLIFSSEAAAIPVFARRYATACTTCHVIIPKLNAFGLAFRANGYRMPAEEKFIQQEDVSLGAPAWKQIWPKGGVWPGKIADRPPIAVRFQLDSNIYATGKPPLLNFDVPHELSFYMGGNLGTGVSYFGEIEFKSGDKAVMNLAFVNFDNLFGSSPLFNIRFGRIEPVAAPFSRFYRRLTSSDPFMTEMAPFSGAFKWKDRQMGVELYGARTGPGGRGGVEWGLGVLNGSDTNKDTNTMKDLEWSLAYKFGGYGVTGPTEEEPDSLAQTDNFVDNSFKIGTFGITGRRGIGSTDSDYHRVGVKFDAFIGRLNLYGAYQLGRDKLLDSNTKINSGMWFVEADYVLTPWIVPLIRYDQADVTELLGTPTPKVRRIVPAVRFAIRANVTLLVEGRFHLRDNNFLASTRKRGEGRVRVDFLF